MGVVHTLRGHRKTFSLEDLASETDAVAVDAGRVNLSATWGRIGQLSDGIEGDKASGEDWNEVVIPWRL